MVEVKLPNCQILNDLESQKDNGVFEIVNQEWERSKISSKEVSLNPIKAFHFSDKGVALFTTFMQQYFMTFE